MYIGPWQEYKLSKQRSTQRQPQGPVSMTVEMKKELESALKSTLDSSAAEAAMKAMDNFFKSQNPAPVDQLSLKYQHPPVYQHSYPSQDSERRRRHRDSYGLGSIDSLSLHMDSIASDNRTSIIQLNPSNQYVLDQDRKFIPMIHSARDTRTNPYNQPSPLSVRSTQSEPTQSALRVAPISKQTNQYASLNSANLTLHQSRMQQLQDGYFRESPSLGAAAAHQANNLNVQSAGKASTPAAASTNSGYDSNALVSFLKMERNHRARVEISRLTGWTAVSNNEKVVADRPQLPEQPPKKDKATILKEKKIERLQQMKKLYMEGAGLGSGSPRKSLDAERSDDKQREEIDHLTELLATAKPSKSPKVSLDIANDELTSLPVSSSAVSPSSKLKVSLPNSAPLQESEQVPRRHQFGGSVTLNMSPPGTPHVQDIEHFTDEQLLLVSKYFQTGSRGEVNNESSNDSNFIAPILLQHRQSIEFGSRREPQAGTDGRNTAETINGPGDDESDDDYVAMALHDQSLRRANSMDRVDSEDPLQRHPQRGESYESNNIIFNDEDDPASRTMSQNPSLRRLRSASSRGNRPMDSTFGSPVTNRKGIAEIDNAFMSPPDTSRDPPLLVTGSFAEDLNSGHIDDLLSWTRTLDAM